jgi:hypothetical protein
MKGTLQNARDTAAGLKLPPISATFDATQVTSLLQMVPAATKMPNEARYALDAQIAARLAPPAIEDETPLSPEHSHELTATKIALSRSLRWEVTRQFSSPNDLVERARFFSDFAKIIHTFEGEFRGSFAEFAVQELLANAHDNWLIQRHASEVATPRVSASARRDITGFEFAVTDYTGTVPPPMRPYLFEHHFNGREVLEQLTPETAWLAGCQEDFWPLRPGLPNELAKRSIKANTGLPLIGGCGAGLAITRKRALETGCGYFYQNLGGGGSKFGITIPYSFKQP